MSIDAKILESYNSYLKNLIPESINNAKLHDINLEEFKDFIKDMLMTRAGLSEYNADNYVSLQSLESFITSVTHFSVDPFNNYEYMETVGDSTLNNIFVWIYFKYIDKKAPDLNITRKVYTMSKLKSTGVSKQSYAKMCDLIGLTKFIRYKELKYKEKESVKQIIMDDSMKEDVFEAFFGCMCMLFDSVEEVNCGYNIVSYIINNLVEEHKILENISIRPEDLEDPNTMIKEIYDSLKNISKENTYEIINEGKEDPQNPMIRAKLVLNYVNNDNKETTVFTDYGLNMKELRKKLSKKALDYLGLKYNVRWEYKNKSGN
jgi:dsRNA-specific ribonuclease